MATAKPGVWGIDLGQCGLKALRLELEGDEVVATAFDYVEHPKILSQPDADPDQLTRAALDQFLSRNSVKGDVIAISVPGQTGLARFVKLPPVESKKIPDIVRFEAKQQIPFPLEEVVWDWQTIKASSIAEGFVENEIGLFAMKRDMVNRALQAFKDVRIEVHHIQMTPLALCNFAIFDLLAKGGPGGQPFDSSSKQALVLVDMGADSSNMVITDGDRVIWQRPIPIGGNHFTRALTKEMKLTFAKAEHVKRNASKAEDPRKIFQAMKPVFTDFVGELQRSLGFFTNSHRDVKIEKMVGMGNGFRLPGLQKLIGQSLNLEVDRVAEFKRLTGDNVVKAAVFRDNIMSFTVAYGLALQGLAATKLTTNLLPQEIHRERFIRAKKPWLAASAAALLVGVGLSATPLGGLSKAADEAKGAAESNSLQAIKKVDETQKRAAEANAARQAAIRQGEGIVFGGKERLNWAMLHLFINQCVPQPDGTNLLPAARQLYWDEQSGRAKKAWEALQARQLRGERRELRDLYIPNLIQVNIQGVYARPCRSPQEANMVLQQLRQDAKPSFQFTEDNLDWLDQAATGQGKPVPKVLVTKPGWFVEVHGFTYHEGTDEDIKRGLGHGPTYFILNTFMANLRDPSKQRFSLPKDAEALEAFINELKASRGPTAGNPPRHVDVSHVVLWRKQSEWVPPASAPEFNYINKYLWITKFLTAAAPPPVRTGVEPETPPVTPPPIVMDGGPISPPLVKPAPPPPGPPPAPPQWSGTRYLDLQDAHVNTEASVPPEKPLTPRPSPDYRRRTEFVIFFYWVEPTK